MAQRRAPSSGSRHVRPSRPVMPIESVRERGSKSIIPVTCGSASVILGGIVAAVTGPTGWSDGSWVAAFLVLVMGVGQIGLGVGQAFVGPRPPTRRTVVIESTLWNLGSLTVIAGTLMAAPLLVSFGGLALVIALTLLARVVRTANQHGEWLGRAYRSLVLVLLVSIPVGIALAWVRS